MFIGTSNSSAYFDALAISIRLERQLKDVANGEVHLFAYLSCLLWLYKRSVGNIAVAAWDYQFAGTREGTPFSAAINDALRLLNRNGLIQNRDERFVVTKLGMSEFELLLSLPHFKHRDAYIEGACSSILVLPIGMVRHALSQEPELKTASLFEENTPLLDVNNLGMHQLQEHFAALDESVGSQVNDLMVPTMIWLTFLEETSQSKVERSKQFSE